MLCKGIKTKCLSSGNILDLGKFLPGLSLLIILSLSFLSGCKEQPVIEVVEFPQSFADLVDKVQPAVVNISTTTTVRVPGYPFQHFFGQNRNDPFGDFFENFFGAVPDRELKQRSLGTGFIIDMNGLILTNNHVVERADEIKVKLTDSREFRAVVIGRDPKTDLALIKISSPFEKLPVLLLGDSDHIRVGDWVLAIGNPFGLEHTVTKGIISATGRVIGSGAYDNFLQTDAPINPGNSGGPLINLHGEVIGINTAIVPGGQGLGFAIPSNMAKAITTQLADKGVVTRGWLGVSIQKVTPELAASFGRQDSLGALVTDVVPKSPADRAGIKAGDIIKEVNRRPVKTPDDFYAALGDREAGQSLLLLRKKNGGAIYLML